MVFDDVEDSTDGVDGRGAIIGTLEVDADVEDDASTATRVSCFISFSIYYLCVFSYAN